MNMERERKVREVAGYSVMALCLVGAGLAFSDWVFGTHLIESVSTQVGIVMPYEVPITPSVLAWRFALLIAGAGGAYYFATGPHDHHDHHDGHHHEDGSGI